MTNEELAVRIKDGDTACTEKLWKNLYRLLYKIAAGIYTQKRERCAAAGVTLEDLLQECFFAMMYEELRRAVDSLPDRERKIIRYHFYRGLSLKDCTVLLGMHTQSYAGQVKNKALRHLRQNPKIRSMRSITVME